MKNGSEHNHMQRDGHPAGAGMHNANGDPGRNQAVHASHDRHAGHSVAMFRDKFWLSCEASSHQTSISKRPNVAASEVPKATVIAKLMRVIMPGL
jgi:hypothetical protein